MNLYRLKILLKEAIVFVYNNEKHFISENFCEFDKEFALEEFYMASEMCRVVVSSPNSNNITATIKTDYVLDWIQSHTTEAEAT